MSYIKPGAKSDQQSRLREQVGAVQEKVTKWADKIVVGQYTGEPEQERKEGDVWEDSDGKQWTVKNGIKQTIRKTQGAVMPFWCPKCEGSLAHWLDKKFYRMKGACHNCVIKYEGKMRRIEGLWEIYEKRQLRRNEKAWLKDAIQEREGYLEGFRTPQLHFQDGRWEELAHKSLFEATLKRVEQDIQFLKDRFSQIEKEEEQDAEEYNRLEEWEKENPWQS